ncbi:MAG: cytochrome c biogenesis protein ResB [Telluria sp.]
MSTTGITLKSRNKALAEAVELVSSMRFAITMLVMIMIAAIIGTVLKQNEALPNYINQFGPFWYDIFGKLGLYSVYSAWWFILILALLLASTTFCIIRNAPKMIRDMRSWREHVREESLRNFHHNSEWVAPLTRVALAEQTAERLRHAGYAAKIVDKPNATLVTAKKGAANKFGYIFAHSAIIIILLGGMLDSDLPIQFQERVLGKVPFQGGGLIADIPAQHRLGVGNPTYRANVSIPEGESSDMATVQRADGVLLQPLPFTIHLKRFVVDFYSTGMPKLFASDVLVRDSETGKTFAATIKVNEPLIYKGIAIYQSSFGDGGTKLTLTGFPMTGTGQAAFPLKGEINGATQLNEYAVEWTDFRPFNVENVAGGMEELRGVKERQSLGEQFAATLDKHSGSAAKEGQNKNLKNVGPSVQYKLRDKTGQAREYQNYMQPVTIDGDQVFLAGMRVNPNDAFSYLRIPADDAHSVKEWMRMRAALADPALRAAAAARYVQRVMPAAQDGAAAALAAQLQESAAKSLAIFAGQGTPGGYAGVARFLEKIPAAEQKKAADIFMKILNGSMWELWQAAREQAGLPPATPDDAHGRFLQLATNALSDSFFYGAPVYLQLDDFVHVQASVLQVTRSPGKFVVYLGSLFLVLGVFAMFYIRERRVWVWLRDDAAGAHALMAMSTQRKTLDFENEFNDLKAKLPQSA